MNLEIRLNTQSLDGTLTPAKISTNPTDVFVFPAVQITSTDSGFLPPSLTTAQRDAIATPLAGMIIYNTDTVQLETYNGATWSGIGGGGGSGSSKVADLLPAGTQGQVVTAVANAWGPANHMITARKYNGLVTLPNGKVLAVGGTDTSDNALASCELYNPTTGTWSAAASMSGPRMANYNFALLLQDGRVIVAGGADNNGTNNLDTAEIYDYTLDTWTPTATPMGRAHGSQSNACVLGNGQVLVVGGQITGFISSAVCELYDPGTDTWTSTSGTDNPGDPGNMSHRRWGLGLVQSNSLSSAGCLAIGGAGPGAAGTAEVYDPISNAWSDTPAMPHGHNEPVSAVLLQSLNIMAVGGNPASTDVSIYNAGLGTWAPGANSTYPHIASTAITMGSQVLVFGGVGAEGTQAELYDYVQDKWTTVFPLTTPRTAFVPPTAAYLQDGRVMAAGGYAATTTNSVELFSTSAQNVWELLSSIVPTPAAITDSNILASASINPTKVLAAKEGQVLSSAINTFGMTANLNTARFFAAAAVFPTDQILIAGGSGPLTSAELFNTATESWSVTGPMHYGYFGWNDRGWVLPNTRILFAGNSAGGAVAETYDVNSNSWQFTGPMQFSHGASNTISYKAASAQLTDGRVLVSGGVFPGTTQIDSAEIYDQGSDQWTATATPMNSVRRGHTLTLLQNSTVLCVGGTSGAATSEIYDPGADTWTFTTGNMNTGRARFFQSTLLNSGLVLITGGSPTGSSVTAVCETFDSGTGTWTVVAPMNYARCNHKAILLSTGNVLVVGGTTDFGSGLPGPYILPAEIYDTTGNTWTVVENLQSPRVSPAVVSLANGDVSIIGGYDDGALASTERYSSFLRNEWRTPAGAVQKVSADTTLTVPGYTFCDTTASFFTVSLPDARAVKGQAFQIEIITGTNQVILHPFGSQTIDGNGGDQSLDPNNVAGGPGMKLVSDGSNWQIDGTTSFIGHSIFVAGITSIGTAAFGSITSNVGISITAGDLTLSGTNNINNVQVISAQEVDTGSIVAIGGGSIDITAPGGGNQINLTAESVGLFCPSLTLLSGGPQFTMSNAGNAGVIQWPGTTTADRDALSPLDGWMLYNIDSHKPDFYNGTAWVELGGGSGPGAATFYDDQFTYSGSNIFTLSNPPDVNSAVIFQNGLALAPTTGYTLSGTTLTVLTSLTTGDVIQAKYAVGAGAGGSQVVAEVSLSGQVADIPVTTLFTPTTDGTFHISAYTVYTAGDGTDTIATFNTFWTDVTSVTQAGAGMGNSQGQNSWGSGVIGNGNSSAGPGQPVSFDITIQAIAGQPISYSVTGGSYASSVYSVYVIVEQLEPATGGGGGTVTVPVQTLTGDTTLVTAGYYIINNGVLTTITLPDATTMTGQIITIKNYYGNGNGTTITPFGGQTIDGMAGLSIPAGNTYGQGVSLISDGVGWYSHDTAVFPSGLTVGESGQTLVTVQGASFSGGAVVIDGPNAAINLASGIITLNGNTGDINWASSVGQLKADGSIDLNGSILLNVDGSASFGTATASISGGGIFSGRTFAPAYDPFTDPVQGDIDSAIAQGFGFIEITLTTTQSSNPFTLAAGIVSGQMLIIANGSTSGVNQLAISIPASGTTTNLSAGDTVQVIWNGSVWYRVGLSN